MEGTGTTNIASGSLAMNGTLTLSGGRMLTGGGSSTTSLTGGSAECGIGAMFNFPSGLFQWTGGTISTASNALTNAASGFMALAPTTNANDLVLTGTLNNVGTITRRCRGVGSCCSRRDPEQQRDIQHRLRRQRSAVRLQRDDVFNNMGTFEKTAGAGTTSVASLAFDNASGGIVTVTTGTLALGNGTLSGGTFNVSGSAVLNLTGGNAPTLRARIRSQARGPCCKGAGR